MFFIWLRNFKKKDSENVKKTVPTTKTYLLKCMKTFKEHDLQTNRKHTYNVYPTFM